MYTDNSLVISAPTGSGKTVIFELAVVRLLMQRVDISTGKIIYGQQHGESQTHSMCMYMTCVSVMFAVAPIKALCSERAEDWQAKFGPLGLHCCELTGDSQVDDYFELQRAHVVMTTPVREVKGYVCDSINRAVNITI